MRSQQGESVWRGSSVCGEESKTAADQPSSIAAGRGCAEKQTAMLASACCSLWLTLPWCGASWWSGGHGPAQGRAGWDVRQRRGPVQSCAAQRCQPPKAAATPFCKSASRRAADSRAEAGGDALATLQGALVR